MLSSTRCEKTLDKGCTLATGLGHTRTINPDKAVIKVAWKSRLCPSLPTSWVGLILAKCWESLAYEDPQADECNGSFPGYSPSLWANSLAIPLDSFSKALEHRTPTQTRQHLIEDLWIALKLGLKSLRFVTEGLVDKFSRFSMDVLQSRLLWRACNSWNCSQSSTRDSSDYSNSSARLTIPCGFG